MKADYTQQVFRLGLPFKSILNDDAVLLEEGPGVRSPSVDKRQIRKWRGAREVGSWGVGRLAASANGAVIN